MSLDRTEILHKRGLLGLEIDAMDVVFNTPEFQESSEMARVLFIRQRHVMAEYYNIICERIEEIDGAWIGEPEDRMVKLFIERLKAWWIS